MEPKLPPKETAFSRRSERSSVRAERKKRNPRPFSRGNNQTAAWVRFAIWGTGHSAAGKLMTPCHLDRLPKVANGRQQLPPALGFLHPLAGRSEGLFDRFAAHFDAAPTEQNLARPQRP